MATVASRGCALKVTLSKPLLLTILLPVATSVTGRFAIYNALVDFLSARQPDRRALTSDF
jgi:hypothetical protein